MTTGTIRDVASGVIAELAAEPGASSFRLPRDTLLRLASWVLAVTEPCGDVPSVDEAQRVEATLRALIEAREMSGDVNELHRYSRAVIALHARLADERAKVAALEAEVARLRELMREVADEHDDIGDGATDATWAMIRAAADTQQDAMP